MTRIASSPFEIWRDIYETNVEEVRDMARRLLRHLDAHVEALSAVVERPGELAALFQRAADLRSAIPRDTKGFLRPLSEILVVVEDRPGIIAEITGVLADNGINIKDIEVLKIREGSGGTIRLGFASSEEAQRAAELLSQRGFNVRVRE
jgi:prephenate dehydrogenase